ncbi:hypothetical protein BT69DRAFT_863908 [Atractiella rhizophila]|nr:hypothetical protein BT69DRAFT_863908 [Atractiella rhizophila]
MASPSPSAYGLPALDSLIVGCKVMVDRRPAEEARKAEILSIRERKKIASRLLRRKDSELGAQETGLEYYVHYQDFNKVC